MSSTMARVVGNVSADDVALVKMVEKTTIEEAHREERMLEEALQSEHDEEDIDNLHKHQKKDDDSSDEPTKDD